MLAIKGRLDCTELALPVLCLYCVTQCVCTVSLLGLYCVWTVSLLCLYCVCLVCVLGLFYASTVPLLFLYCSSTVPVLYLFYVCLFCAYTLFVLLLGSSLCNSQRIWKLLHSIADDSKEKKVSDEENYLSHLLCWHLSSGIHFFYRKTKTNTRRGSNFSGILVYI